jgi:predicted RNase H-like nuclease (RuvC/YqgF family)
VQVADSGNCTL